MQWGAGAPRGSWRNRGSQLRHRFRGARLRSAFCCAPRRHVPETAALGADRKNISRRILMELALRWSKLGRVSYFYFEETFWSQYYRLQGEMKGLPTALPPSFCGIIRMSLKLMTFIIRGRSPLYRSFFGLWTVLCFSQNSLTSAIVHTVNHLYSSLKIPRKTVGE